MENQEKKTKGGRPKKGASNGLNSQIGVRFSMADRVLIRLKAEKAGLTASDFIRQSALSATIKQPPSEEQRKLYRDLSGMANNLNQLAKEAHKQNLPTLAPLLLRAINEINTTLKLIQNDY